MPGYLVRPPEGSGLSRAGILRWCAGDPDLAFLCDAAEGADIMISQGGEVSLSPQNYIPDELHGEFEQFVADELRKGWITSHPPPRAYEPSVSAPVLAVVSEKKTRFCFDFSHADSQGHLRGVNAWVDRDRLWPLHLPYAPDVAAAVHRVRRHGEKVILIARDVSKAYRRIPVRADQQRFLRFRWKARDYWHTRLPFGLASAAHIQCRVAAAWARAVMERFLFSLPP